LVALFIVNPNKIIRLKLYYAHYATENNWGKRDLRNQIERKAFERNEIANIQLSTYHSNLLNTFKDQLVFMHIGLEWRIHYLWVFYILID
jgi:predicted nuclease of restriction endonuclease-like (RecB) superfamily